MITQVQGKMINAPAPLNSAKTGGTLLAPPMDKQTTLTTEEQHLVNDE